MADSATPKPREAARGRPFAAGRSGNPGGRQPGCRNRASLAAEALLDGEAALLTRRAVELAIEGDPTALKIRRPLNYVSSGTCCRAGERAVRFAFAVDRQRRRYRPRDGCGRRRGRR